MLPKARRIQRKEFGNLIKTGRRYSSANLSLFVQKIPENRAQLSQFSFSASKKVAKHAVQRNKLRRIGYSAIRSHLHNIKDGYQCFFVYKKSLGEPKFPLIETETLMLLSSAGVIL